MKCVNILLIAIVFLIIVTGCTDYPDSASTSTPAHTSEQYIQAWDSQDSDAAYKLLSTGAKKVNTETDIHNSMIRNWDFNRLVKITVDNMDISGDIARGKVRITFESTFWANQGERSDDIWEVVLVQEGSSWKIATPYRGQSGFRIDRPPTPVPTSTYTGQCPFTDIKWIQTEYQGSPVSGVYIVDNADGTTTLYLNDKPHYQGKWVETEPNQFKVEWIGRGIDTMTISSDCLTKTYITDKGERSVFVRV